jgi:hypothetical protein
MTSPPPPASNVRIPWSDLPARVRAEVERRLGSPVVAARTQTGGFSPGVAARLELADGGRAFVKAVSGREDRSSLRLRTVSWNGSVGVITLKLDQRFWPTYELRRTDQGWKRAALQ